MIKCSLCSGNAMEKSLHAQRTDASAVQQTMHISFKEVYAHEIQDHIPAGYRLATFNEAKTRYDADPAFRADAERTGSLWVMNFKEGQACPARAMAYYGLFRIANQEGKDYRPVTYTSHVAYVRNPRMSISRKQELMTTFKNTLRKELQSILY